MSELSQFSIFSDEAIQELAARIYCLLPGENFVTVMFEELGVCSNILTVGPDLGGLQSLDATRNGRRIDDVCEKMSEHPPWNYDTKKYPVMFFSIESFRNYYGVIGVTINNVIEDFNDCSIIDVVVDQILKHLPEPFEEDIEEPIGVRYIYGAITNPNACYVYNPDGV